jgi:hypothetical protein
MSAASTKHADAVQKLFRVIALPPVSCLFPVSVSYLHYAGGGKAFIWNFQKKLAFSPSKTWLKKHRSMGS